MEIKKTFLVFMVRWYDEINQQTHHDEVVDYQLNNYLLNCEYEVAIEGHYEIELNNRNENLIAEMQQQIDDLVDDRDELQSRLDNIQSTLDDALSYLHDVESEIDTAYDECDY